MILAQALTAGPTYPDHKLTPGASDPKITQATINKTICLHHYTNDSRNVSEKTKREVYERYGINYTKHRGEYEVDHFESLELGGLNDISNLWPQRFSPKPGAREKDVVETHLKREICSGKISLDRGRSIIKKDWYACYLKIKRGGDCK
jgi:hypothetical protein